jgi:catechol 2,3-dioxygenase-like lactoylglutathione lyase family enzyme
MSKGKAVTTIDGIPYLYGSGEITTLPSNVNKLTAYDGANADRYGNSGSVGSGRIVIGSYTDDISRGSAYVYDLDGNLITKLTAYDRDTLDRYGNSVSVGSGRIVIGAYYDDDGIPYQGSAYVYDLDGNLITKLTAFDAAEYDTYGNSVSVGSGRIIIGAYSDEIAKGSAYVYDLDGNLITKLTAYDGAENDAYGTSVSVGSGRIVIGSSYDGDNGDASGSAYVYDLDGNLITKLTAYDGGAYDFYGTSVSVGSGRIVIGAYGDDDNGNTDSGSAYVYDLDGNLITKLTAGTDGAASDNYGYSVSVGSGRIVIGAIQDDDDGDNSGSVYVYDLDGNLITKLTAGTDGAANDQYGRSVSVGSGRIVIGAYQDNNRGSAYVYETPSACITPYDLQDWERH